MSSTVLPSLVALLALAAPAAADTLKVPAQFPTINAAVLAAQAGDTVSVAKGVYLEQVFVGVAGIKLVGKGAVIDGQYGGVCIDIQADDVSVSGFTLANGQTGLFAAGAGTSVSKCVVRNCGSAGIVLQGGSCTISANTVSGCGDDGINFSRTVAGETVIEKNTCTQNGEDGILTIGDELTVAKNRCERNAGVGLRATVVAFALAALPEGLPVVIEKNTSADNLEGLVLICEDQTLVTVQKNDFVGNDSRGLLANTFSGTAITGNSCDDNGDAGIHLITGAAQVSKNTATGNVRDGIVVQAASDVGDGNGSDNVLTGNTCKDNGRDGIAIVSGGNNVLQDNKCTGNGDDGIDLYPPAVADTTLDHNTCSDNGHEGIDNGGIGSLIVDNVCKGNGEGLGPDIAGTGDLGLGSVVTFEDNKFGTGGATEPSRLDNYGFTGP